MFSGIKKAVAATFTVEGVTTLVIIYIVFTALTALHAAPSDAAKMIGAK